MALPVLLSLSFADAEAQDASSADKDISSGEISGAPLFAPQGQSLQQTLMNVQLKKSKDFINEVAPTPAIPGKTPESKPSGIIAPPGTNFRFVPQNVSDVFSVTQPVGSQLVSKEDASVRGQGANQEQANTVQFNFKNAKLSVVVEFIAKLYDLIPVVAPGADQQVTISTPGKISPEKAYAVFTSVINSISYAVIRTDRYLQVVPKSSAQQYPLKIYYGDDISLLPDTDEMVMQIIPCKNVSASDMQKHVVPITSFGLGAANVTSDPNSNILIISDIASNMKRIIKMVKLLDVTGVQRYSSMETTVYYINYLNAKDLADCLNNSFKIQSSVTVKDGVVENNQIIIQPFADANAILVTATPALQKIVGESIANLDKRKKQVLLKVKLLELNQARNFDLGSDMTFNSGSSSGHVGPATALNDNTNLLSDTTKKPQGSYMFKSNNVEFAVQALLEKSKGKLLSQPKLLTADNQKASLVIGQQEPILKSTTLVNTANSNTVSDYSYLNIGITLTITPHVNPDNDVSMALDLKISDIQEMVNVGGQMVPRLSNRQIQTSAAVKNDHTLVIGGIISQAHTASQASLPGLADIPGLGWLFGQSSSKHEQTELIILISPVVVDQVDAGDKLTEEEKKKVSIGEKDFENFESNFNELDVGGKKLGDKIGSVVNPKSIDKNESGEDKNGVKGGSAEKGD